MFYQLNLIAMEQWQDQGIVLAVRRHGENGAIASLLTQGQGRTSGYVRGAQGSKMRGTLEVGNLVDANWIARSSDNLGTLKLELSRAPAAHFMQDPLKLAALQAACALCDSALPEREEHAGMFRGLSVLLEAFQSDIWAESYVMWEIALLKELGFALDISKCAGGGDSDNLAYVSPKTGRAVSLEAGAPYKERLLLLPGFLRGRSDLGAVDVLTGLELTGYFFEHWVYAHHSHGVPEARLRFEARFAKTVGASDIEGQD